MKVAAEASCCCGGLVAAIVDYCGTGCWRPIQVLVFPCRPIDRQTDTIEMETGLNHIHRFSTGICVFLSFRLVFYLSIIFAKSLILICFWTFILTKTGFFILCVTAISDSFILKVYRNRSNVFRSHIFKARTP